MSMAAFSSPEKRKEKNSKILQRQQIKGESAELSDITTTQVLTVQYAQAFLLLIWITGIPYHRKEMVQIRKNCAPAQAEESSSRAGSNVGSSAHLHPHSSCCSHGFSRECCKDLWVVMQTKCMEGFEVYLSSILATLLTKLSFNFKLNSTFLHQEVGLGVPHHRTVEVGRDPLGSPSPNLLLQAVK